MKSKKLLLSFFVILMFAVYVIYQRLGEGRAPIIQPPPAPPSSAAAVPGAPMTGSGTPMRGIYQDGQYVGNRVDAYYGYVQVRVAVQSSKIVDVVFLDYPKDRSASRYINSQAMPYLKTETLRAQNANVDVISGATATSDAFRKSLASALAQAKF